MWICKKYVSQFILSHYWSLTNVSSPIGFSSLGNTMLKGKARTGSVIFAFQEVQKNSWCYCNWIWSMVNVGFQHILFLNCIEEWRGLFCWCNGLGLLDWCNTELWRNSNDYFMRFIWLELVKFWILICYHFLNPLHHGYFTSYFSPPSCFVSGSA